MSKKTLARDFFLYEKLNENDTKNLRKSTSLIDEKKILAEVFGLDAESTKVTEILLDFHSINYNFAKKHSFSNEKISVFLDMMNYMLYYMIDHQLMHDAAYEHLQDILNKHSIQRPPYAVMIFTSSDIQLVNTFFVQTFLRHFSLYEFAFKPRVELVLRTEDFVPPQKILEDLGEEKDPKEMECLLEYIGEDKGDEEQQSEKEAVEEEKQVEDDQQQFDDTNIEAVLGIEMNRLNKIMERKMKVQDKQINENIKNRK